MPRPFPDEFRRRAVALVRAGNPIATAAAELGVSAAAIHKWVRQDQIDRGERPGITTPGTSSGPKRRNGSNSSRRKSRSWKRHRSSSERTVRTQKGPPIAGALARTRVSIRCS
ncbi:transposase [Frondihabitans sp. 4ASC-45]|uniref:transposase n=1 Tax=Frondihabitans sp. 4ASC-45 TaxID=3111636 RepID=UPI003C2EC6FA